VGRVSPEVARLAEEAAGERGAKLVRAPEDPGSELRLRALGPFQRRNFALALAAAEVFLGDLDRERVAAVASTLTIPGRLERIAGDPPAFLDAAHNPDGAVALAAALPEVAGAGPVVACLAILADKDAPAMVRALAPVLDRAVCAEIPAEELAAHGRPGSGSYPAVELARLCEAAGLKADVEPRFDDALSRARTLALDASGGTLLITGSHYLLAHARISA
jgi:dihydrofolate synthase / folylpolyglutamate synthase